MYRFIGIALVAGLIGCDEADRELRSESIAVSCGAVSGAYVDLGTIPDGAIFQALRCEIEEGRSVCRSVANSWQLIEDSAMVQGFCSANAGGVTWRLDYAWADRPDPIVIAP